jgi:hypothetical protein
MPGWGWHPLDRVACTIPDQIASAAYSACTRGQFPEGDLIAVSPVTRRGSALAIPRGHHRSGGGRRIPGPDDAGPGAPGGPGPRPSGGDRRYSRYRFYRGVPDLARAEKPRGLDSRGDRNPRFTALNGDLSFEVEDDGRGSDAAIVKKGSGLTNMTDRLEVLGGSLQIDACPGRGCRLRGEVL